MKSKKTAVFLACILAVIGCGDSEPKQNTNPPAKTTTAPKTAEPAKKAPKVEPKKEVKAEEKVEVKTEAPPAEAKKEKKEEAVKADHEIKMLNAGPDGSTMVYQPGFIQAKPGETVRFVSVDPGHNSVSHFTPEGAVTWTGAINQDVVVTLDKEGVYIYKCVPHNVMGMAGVIQVGKAGNKDAAIESAKALSAQFVMNKDRLTKLLEQVK